MRPKLLLVLLPVALLLLCGSCFTVVPARNDIARVRLVQITPFWLVPELRGPAQLEYQLVVHNNSDEPLHLTSLELRTVRGGAYVLEPQVKTFRTIVGPHATLRVRFWATAWFRGGALAAGQPVTIHGAARFETAHDVWYAVIVEEIP